MTTRYHVVGTKAYSSDIQLRLGNIVAGEQMDISKGLKSYTQEVPVELFSITGSHTNAKNFNDRHGKHSHYFLLNDHSLNTLKQYNYHVDVIDEIDLIDPMNVGFSLLLRNTRFV